MNIREQSMEWFLSKTEKEKADLKHKHYSGSPIAYCSQWGFHFTFGEIEKMYKKEVTSSSEGGEE